MILFPKRIYFPSWYVYDYDFGGVRILVLFLLFYSSTTTGIYLMLIVVTTTAVVVVGIVDDFCHSFHDDTNTNTNDTTND